VIDFWFSIGSTYTYLSVMRLAEVEQTSGIAFRWQPFSVRQIMIEMDNIPFRTKPVKAAYMWRDIKRRAEMHGLPARVPAPYPLAQWDVANRVAVLGAAEGWIADYARATYRRWFQDGLEPGSEPNLSDSLHEIGQDPSRVTARHPRLQQPMRRRPIRPASSASSARRPSRWTGNCSGATIAWTMPSLGTGMAL
jgi:2-hydroxychromene-2-carboxylate isomerase